MHKEVGDRDADPDHEEAGNQGELRVADPAVELVQGLEQGEDDIEPCRKADPETAQGDHIRIIRQAEQVDQGDSRHRQDKRHDAAEDRLHDHCGLDAVDGPFLEACTDVLAGEGGQGHGQVHHRHGDEALDPVRYAEGGHHVGTEEVHEALHEQHAHRDNGLLDGSRQTVVDDGTQDVPVKDIFFPLELVDFHPFVDVDKAQHITEDLRHDRSHRHTHDAPAQERYKREVQHDIGEGGDDQEVQRGLAVADGPQDGREVVVQELGRHADEHDAQVQDRLGQDLIRRAQQPQQRRGDDDPGQAQHNGQPDNEQDARGHDLLEPFVIPGPVGLGNDDGHAGGEAEGHCKDQELHGHAAADGGQRVLALEVADDNRVDGGIQLLEHVPDQHRYSKREDDLHRLAGSKISGHRTPFRKKDTHSFMSIHDHFSI